MRGSYIKLAVQIGAVLSGFFLAVPFVFASTLYFQPLNDVMYSTTGSVFQGLGEGLVTSTTTITNIGFQYWYPVINHSFGAPGSYCIYEYDSRASYEDNPLVNPTANSACYSSGNLAVDYTTDSSGLLGTSTISSYTLSPYKFYAISPPGLFVTSGMLGTSGAFNYQSFFSNVGVATTTGGSLYFQVTTNGISSFFTPDPNFSGFASSSLSVVCEPPSNILDVGGGVRYGICTSVSFLFIPPSSSLNNYSQLGMTLATKIPFSYFYDSYSIYSNVFSTSTDSNFITLSIDLHNTGIGSSTPLGNILPSAMDLLSTTTVNYFLPAGIREKGRTLASWILYIMFFEYLYTIAGQFFDGRSVGFNRVDD